jgi:hypothetical protein
MKTDVVAQWQSGRASGPAIDARCLDGVEEPAVGGGVTVDDGLPTVSVGCKSRLRVFRLPRHADHDNGPTIGEEVSGNLSTSS